MPKRGASLRFDAGGAGLGEWIMGRGVGGERLAVTGILAVSGLAFAFLVWLIYFRAGPAEGSDAFAALPKVNAFLNGVSACCVAAGFIAIRGKNKRVHLALMIAAFVFSTLFLVGYIVYHNVHGDTTFRGMGAIRPFYFFVLISHIGCTVFALPLILLAFFFSLAKHFERHRKIVRFALPLWLYVSVTGVAIYFLLRAYS